MQQNYFPDVFCSSGSSRFLRNLFLRYSLFFLFISPFIAAGQDSTVYVPDTGFVYHNLQQALLHPESVYRLDLSRKKLDSVPPEVFSFPNLKELNLSRNRIEDIPPAIGNLVHLERLDVSNNKLADLPDEIGMLTDLLYLGLNRNIIVKLPPAIGNLKELQVLELWDNELEDLPDEIGNLQNLKVVELRGILFSEETQARIDSLIVKTAKLYMSPSCNCKY